MVWAELLYCTFNSTSVKQKKWSLATHTPISPSPSEIRSLQIPGTNNRYQTHHTSDIQKNVIKDCQLYANVKDSILPPTYSYYCTVYKHSTSCSTCSLNMLTVKNRNKLIQMTHTATKMIVLQTPNLLELNTKAITHIAHAISQDTTHLVNHLFQLLTSGKRFTSLRCNKAHHCRSFSYLHLRLIKPYI